MEHERTYNGIRTDLLRHEKEPLSTQQFSIYSKIEKEQNYSVVKMKKLIIIIVLIAKCHVLFSQEENFEAFFVDAITKAVPVYANDTGNDIITNIREFTEEENWHGVEILEKSDKRYKVRITSCVDENPVPINGWIDKEQCGVWLYGEFINLSLTIVSFYLTPNQPYPFLKITDTFADGFGKYTNDKAAPVLDYELHDGKYWIKTVITKDKKKVVGWTMNYCPNVFCSCN